MLYLFKKQNQLLESPLQINLESLFDNFKKQFIEIVGNEPNIFAFGNHTEWIVRRVHEIVRLHKQYNCGGDLEEIFIEKLIQDNGFKRITYTEVVL